MPPGARKPTDFDPGAKFHVPGNVPYMRYFLAQMLAVPVLPRAVPQRELQRAAVPLLVLRE